jgi:hypothetical protein
MRSCWTKVGGLNQDNIYLNVSGNCTVTGSLIATNGGITLNDSGGVLTVTGEVNATGQVYMTGDNGVTFDSTLTATGGSIYVGSSSGLIAITGATSSTGSAITSRLMDSPGLHLRQSVQVISSLQKLTTAR